MRLLLDENLSPAVSGFLVEAGHDVVHVRDRGLTSARDDVVLAVAATEERVLISADTDFGTLLARSGANSPSVVLIRRAAGRRAAHQARLLIDNFLQCRTILMVEPSLCSGRRRSASVDCRSKRQRDREAGHGRTRHDNVP
jgi:predicted nuclease of predicted toxin-antitoxin system